MVPCHITNGSQFLSTILDAWDGLFSQSPNQALKDSVLTCNRDFNACSGENHPSIRLLKRLLDLFSHHTSIYTPTIFPFSSNSNIQFLIDFLQISFNSSELTTFSKTLESILSKSSESSSSNNSSCNHFISASFLPPQFFFSFSISESHK